MLAIINYASEIHIFACFGKYLFKNQFLGMAPLGPIFLESLNTFLPAIALLFKSSCKSIMG